MREVELADLEPTWEGGISLQTLKAHLRAETISMGDRKVDVQVGRGLDTLVPVGECVGVWVVEYLETIQLYPWGVLMKEW